MMKPKKVLVFLLTAAMLLTAGCSTSGGENSASGAGSKAAANGENSGAGTTASGELTFWTLNTRQEAIDPIVEKYNSENPDGKIKVSYYDTDGMKDACKVASSSKTLPSMWFNWGGSLGSFYVKNGLTYDLTDYAKKNKWNQKFISSALSLCTLDGKISGYPTAFNALEIYYRKDIFSKYGISVPTTFDQFEQACAKLKENGITPISTGGLKGWHTMRFVELLVEHYAGADQHDKMNTFVSSWDSEPVVQALTKYQEFCNKGYFPKGFLTADPNNTNMALFSGTAAMDIQHQWYDGSIVQNGQDISKYGSFPFPSGGRNRLSSFAEMTQFNKNLTESQLDACVKFMDYYYSDENAAQYGEYYNLPLPKVGAPMPEGQPNVPKIIEDSDKNGIFTITDQALPTEVADKLFDAQDAIANGQMTPKAGAAQIQKAIEDYQSKSK
mgnify:CR=1 FL=1